MPEVLGTAGTTKSSKPQKKSLANKVRMQRQNKLL